MPELPIKELRVWRGAWLEGRRVCWKGEKHNMPVSKEHVESTFSFIVVPPGAWTGVDVVTLIFPFPIALNDFVGGTCGDLAAFDRNRAAVVPSRVGVSGDMR